MKKHKIFSIFMLLVMTFNIFNPFILMAEADTATVNELIEIVNNGYDIIETKISTAKENPLYLTENAYKSAVYTIELESSDLSDDIFELKETLKNLTIGALVTKVNDEVLNGIYQRYIELGNQDFVLNMDDLNTITFIDDDEATPDIIEESTLITEEDLTSYINSHYIESLNNTTLNYGTNFDTILNSYISLYNDYMTNSVNPALTEVTNYYNQVKTYVDEELLKENNPNMLVNGTDIYTLIDNGRIAINNKDGVFNIKELSSNETEINNILVEVKNNVNQFFVNNKTYLELGLDSEITNLNNSYEDVINNIKTWYTSKSIDSNNIDYSLLSSSIDSDFKTLINDVFALEDSYTSLNNKIATYLERKPSDSAIINTLLTDLNNNRLIVSEEIILDLLESVVKNADLTSEDIVDNLYFINDLEVSNETKKLLTDAKKSFYSFEITGVENKILEDEVIFYGISSINHVDFDIEYLYKNEVTTENEKHFINLYDRNDWLINSIEIKIAGDFNGNYKLDEKDIDKIHELTVSRSMKKSERILADLNQDGKVDVKDLSAFKRLTSSSSEVSKATSASFNVVKVENGNTISYKIYLKSNGLVETFSYKVKATDDLVFKTLKTNNKVLANSKTKPTHVVGYGNFEDGDLLVTLVYEKKNTDERFTGLQITEGLVICDNKLEIDKISTNSIVENIIEEVEQVVNNTVVLDEEEQEETTPLVETKKEEVKDEEDNKVVVVDDLQEEDKIDWKSIVKIVIVVLLGGFIIYFLSKDDSEEPFEESKNSNNK